MKKVTIVTSINNNNCIIPINSATIPGELTLAKKVLLIYYCYLSAFCAFKNQNFLFMLLITILYFFS